MNSPAFCFAAAVHVRINYKARAGEPECLYVCMLINRIS